MYTVQLVILLRILEENQKEIDWENDIFMNPAAVHLIEDTI